MKIRGFRSLRVVAKRLALLLVSTVLFFGLAQTAVYAIAGSAAPSSIPDPSGVSGDPLKPPSPESLEQMRAQRRAFQSEASKAANSEEKASSGSEVLTEKLNLDEITEENEIFKGDR